LRIGSGCHKEVTARQRDIPEASQEVLELASREMEITTVVEKGVKYVQLYGCSRHYPLCQYLSLVDGTPYMIYNASTWKPGA